MTCAPRGCALPSAARRLWPNAPAPSASSSRSSTAASPRKSVLAYLNGQPLDASRRVRLSADDHRAHRLEGALSRCCAITSACRPWKPRCAGIEQIAEARVLDVISLGIDQDAQENFFHPERQDPRRTGAGGVPVRSADDYRALYAASRRGNYPLLRTYSGTDDFVRLAEMYVETINIAWAAVPLFWFNAMDGRGPHDLESSIREHQELMAWYGDAWASRWNSTSRITGACAMRRTWSSSSPPTCRPTTRARSACATTSPS